MHVKSMLNTEDWCDGLLQPKKKINTCSIMTYFQCKLQAFLHWSDIVRSVLNGCEINMCKCYIHVCWKTSIIVAEMNFYRLYTVIFVA